MGRVSPMVGETKVQSQIASYQRLYRWYSIPPCVTLSNIRYVSRVKWSNPGNGAAPSPTPRCSSYGKSSLRITLHYGRQQLHYSHNFYFNKDHSTGLFFGLPVWTKKKFYFLKRNFKKWLEYVVSPALTASDENSVIKIWRVWNTYSLPLLSVLRCSGAVVLVRSRLWIK